MPSLSSVLLRQGASGAVILRLSEVTRVVLFFGQDHQKLADAREAAFGAWDVPDETEKV